MSTEKSNIIPAGIHMIAAAGQYESATHILKRECGKWVLRDRFTHEFVDSDQYRNDLIGRQGIQLHGMVI